MKDLARVAIALALLTFGAAVRAQSRTAQTAYEGHAHDNRTYPVPPEPARDFPTRTEAL